MARIVSTSGDEFNMLVHGAPTSGTMSFISNQLNNVGQYTSQLLGTAKDMFLTASQAAMNIDYDAILANVASIMSSSTSNDSFSQVIYEPTTIEAIQSASLVVQRWIMANPHVRNEYHKGRIDGYSETYHDSEPDNVGETHTDYQEVMNGMMQVDDDGNSFSVNYLDSLADFDAEDLSINERVNILSTWDRVNMLLHDGGSDPTSVFGESL